MTRPPSGTVTFLFTDIQGSTKLWQSHPREMKVAVARHDALLREVVEANHGVVFKTVGDAACAAFATALDGLSAAVASQLALKAQTWPLPSPILVRMALHTGEAEERDADYFGPALNRVARLLAIGHGGQTLLSLVAAELVRDALPDGVSLREMGEHRLKDLYRPEMVYQVVHPDLASDFPALNSLDTHPHNLPLQPTPFIGRERELAEAARLLSGDGARLLTVTGPGGMGKTRFALQAAAYLIELFPNGVWFVDLAPLKDPAHLSGAIARVLRLKEDSGRALIDALVDHLRGKRMLLVLDNFEQIMPAAAGVARILSECPGVRMVVTSREALSVRGEQVLALTSLSLPKIDRRAPFAISQLGQYEAVRLFIDRATAVDPGFHVTNENAPAVAEICVRLDGIPLAIELAAARIRLLSPQEILKRLDKRLQLLVAPMRDLPERQRTLRAAIGWSHDLLEAGEKDVFRTISVFCGGFSLEASETVCAGSGLEGSVLNRLESLAAKSLLLKEAVPAGVDRLRMLETIREFGLERLREDKNEDEVRDAHAGYFAGLVSRAELEGPNQKLWLDRIELEYENIRAALERFERAGAVEKLAAMACALTPFWEIRCRATEGKRWISRAMERFEALPDTTRAHVLQSAGVMARQAGEYQKSVGYLEQALALFTQAGDEHCKAHVLKELSRTQYRMNDLRCASDSMIRAMEISLRLGDLPLAAKVGLGLGLIDWRNDDLDSSAQRFSECHSIFHSAGYLREEAQALGNLGIIYFTRHEYEAAYTAIRQSLELHEILDDQDDLRNVYNNMADCCFHLGNFRLATVYYQKLLDLSEGDNDERGMSTALAGLAEVELIRGFMETAETLAQRSLETASSIGRCVELGVACRVMGDIALVGDAPLDALQYYQNSISMLEPSHETEELKRASHGRDFVRQLLQETGVTSSVV